MAPLDDLRTAALAALLAAAAGCGATQFKGATPADMASCRNRAREVTHDSWGKNFDDAYDDCMVAKGYKPED